VLTHGHIFARWEGADGRDRFNVECASRGMLSFPDAYYKTWPTPLTDEQVRKGRYLLSLGAAEELAVFVESRGHCLLDNGRTREARMAYEHACRLDPLSPGHWSWLNDARVREASLVPHGGNLNTFSNWGCSMTISCLPTANITLSAEPVRTFPLGSTRYRNYHPTLGRWIERDPVGYVDGINLYEYVDANPNLYTDSAGLQVTPPPIMNPATLMNLTPQEIQIFRDATKGPAFDPKTGNDEAGLKARANHVLRALVLCSRQDTVKKAAKELQDKLDALDSSKLTVPQIARAAGTLVGDAFSKGRAMSAVTQKMADLNVAEGSGPGGGGRTDPATNTVYLPKDRGLPGVPDPALPQGSIPPKTWNECFGGTQPKGLMALAAEIVAEMPHLMAGRAQMEGGERDARARDIWAGIDCCCLKQLLQP
jgi:hypothetical protein